MADEAKRVKLTHSFGPFYRPDSRILILGSFPSVKSREMNFFYGHPQNRFWKVMTAIFEPAGAEAQETVAERMAFLERHGIALYDVIEECTIIGSADSTIRDVKVTDLRPILDAASIGKRIYANGAKSHSLYMKYIFPELGIRAEKLPSTSPANAAWTLPRLIEAWNEVLGPADRKD